MHIRKQRLLTPGPTPLYPPALHAMMASDIHHRTEDFRKLYRSCLADLKEVLGTSNDVLIAGRFGHRRDGSIGFEPLLAGDKVIVCSAGKFGERWAEIAKAYGLDANVITVRYGQAVQPAQRAGGARRGPGRQRRLRASLRDFDRRAHDVRTIAEIDPQDRRDLRGRRHHRPGHHAARHRRLGPRRRGRRIAEVLHDPARTRVHVRQPEGLGSRETANLPQFYFNLKKEKKNARRRRIELDALHGAAAGAGRGAEVREEIGMDKLVENAQLLARATREAAAALGLELFSRRVARLVRHCHQPPKGMDSSVIVKEFRSRFGSIIANGQGSMKGQIFRIAHLGYFDFSDLFAMVAQLEIILAANGYPVKFGTGVAAVQQVYAEVARCEFRQRPTPEDTHENSDR